MWLRHGAIEKWIHQERRMAGAERIASEREREGEGEERRRSSERASEGRLLGPLISSSPPRSLALSQSPCCWQSLTTAILLLLLSLTRFSLSPSSSSLSQKQLSGSNSGLVSLGIDSTGTNERKLELLSPSLPAVSTPDCYYFSSDLTGWTSTSCAGINS